MTRRRGQTERRITTHALGDGSRENGGQWVSYRATRMLLRWLWLYMYNVDMLEV